MDLLWPIFRARFPSVQAHRLLDLQTKNEHEFHFLSETENSCSNCRQELLSTGLFQLLKGP